MSLPVPILVDNRVYRKGDVLTFKEATDELGLLGVTLDQIAEALAVSYASVKQARLDRSTANYRNPPLGWPAALAELAETRAFELNHLAKRLGKA